MGILSTLVPLLLMVGSVVVVIVTYLQWSDRRSRGNAPFPPLAKVKRGGRS